MRVLWIKFYLFSLSFSLSFLLWSFSYFGEWNTSETIEGKFRKKFGIILYEYKLVDYFVLYSIFWIRTLLPIISIINLYWYLYLYFVLIFRSCFVISYDNKFIREIWGQMYQYISNKLLKYIIMYGLLYYFDLPVNQIFLYTIFHINKPRWTCAFNIRIWYINWVGKCFLCLTIGCKYNYTCISLCI